MAITIFSIVFAILLLAYMIFYCINRRINKIVHYLILLIFSSLMCLIPKFSLDNLNLTTGLSWFINSILDGGDIFVTKIGNDVVSLTETNLVYCIYFWFVIVSIFGTHITTILSLYYRYQSNKNSVKKVKHSADYIILGDLTNVKDFTKNFDNECICILPDNEDVKEKALLNRKKNVHFVFENDLRKALEDVEINDHEVTIVSLRNDDDGSIEELLVINDVLSDDSPSKVFINYSSISKAESIRNDKLIKKNIRFFNKDSLAGRMFFDEHHLLSYLPDGYIDDKHAVINNKKINHFIVGLTTTNKDLLVELLRSFYFVGCESKYYVQSDSSFKEMKNLNMDHLPVEDEFNSLYYARKEVEKIIKDEKLRLFNKQYLDQKALSDVEFVKYNSIDIDFRKLIVNNSGDFSFIYIDYGKDSKNIEIAQLIEEYLKICGIKNYQIFINIKNININVKSYFNGKNIEDYLINDDLAYHILYEDRLDDLAKMVNYYYAKAYGTSKSIDEEWNNCSFNNKDSSRESAASIVNKLNLLGLELVVDTNGKEIIDKDTYLNDYYKINNGGNISHGVGRYSSSFDLNHLDKNDPSTNIAVTEHYRWNAFSIMSNVMPVKINDFYVEGKYQKKKKTSKGVLYGHTNVTSIKGLFDLIKTVDEEADVFGKDFDLMDNLYDIIDGTNYKIVKKTL